MTPEDPALKLFRLGFHLFGQVEYRRAGGGQAVARDAQRVRSGRTEPPRATWVLPAAIERVRRKLAGADDGNRKMVDILSAVLTDGLPAVEAACAEAAPIPPMSFSISWLASVILRRRPTSPHRLR